MLLTDILEMLYAENVQRKRVLAGLGCLVVLLTAAVMVRIIGGKIQAQVEIWIAIHVNRNNVLADLVNMKSMEQQDVGIKVILDGLQK